MNAGGDFAGDVLEVANLDNLGMDLTFFETYNTVHVGQKGEHNEQ